LKLVKEQATMIAFVCFPCYPPIHYPSKQLTLHVWLNHFAQVTQKTCIPSVAAWWTLVTKTCQLYCQADIDVSSVFLLNDMAKKIEYKHINFTSK